MKIKDDQVVLLLQAMVKLEKTRSEFAEWLGVKEKRLSNWLQKEGSSERRPVDPVVMKWLPVMVAHELNHGAAPRSSNRKEYFRRLRQFSLMSQQIRQLKAKR